MWFVKVMHKPCARIDVCFWEDASRGAFTAPRHRESVKKIEALHLVCAAKTSKTRLVQSIYMAKGNLFKCTVKRLSCMIKL